MGYISDYSDDWEAEQAAQDEGLAAAREFNIAARKWLACMKLMHDVCKPNASLDDLAHIQERLQEIDMIE